MRTGVRLGVDVGKARIGLARCDPHGLIATPLETVPRARSTGEPGSALGADIRRILELAREHAAIELVVGLPLGLSGHRTPSTDDAERFAARLASAAAAQSGPCLPASDAAPFSVRLVDERLSTVSAQSQLRQAGKKTKQSRNVIDQAAAVVILQHALDMERAGGGSPGTLVEIDTAAPAGGDTA